MVKATAIIARLLFHRIRIRCGQIEWAKELARRS